MKLKNITYTTVFATSFAAIVLGFCTFQPGITLAASTSSDRVLVPSGDLCPIASGPRATLRNVKDPVVVNDVFYSELQLSNDSDYVLGGVKVALAVFDSVDDTVPAYWTVLPENYLLLPDSQLTVRSEFGVSLLPAGTYKVKAFAMQGDEVDLLGTVLRAGVETEGVTMVKSAAAKEGVSVSVVTNGQVYVQTPISLEGKKSIEVAIQTKNNGDVPVVANLLAVVTEGVVPLGTAVSVETSDSVRLIPGGIRDTKVTNDRLVAGVSYTVYVTLINPTALNPVIRVPVVAPDSGSGFEGSWSYISKIGLSEFPLEVDSKVVTCINNIGVNADREVLPEPLGVRLSLSNKVGSFVAEQNNLRVDIGNYFVFEPELHVADFTLVANLLRQRFVLANRDKIAEFYIAGTVTQSYECVEGDLCIPHTVAWGSARGSVDTPYKPYWFYIGVMVAAALLLYIMLRRLPPEDPISEKDISENEYETE